MIVLINRAYVTGRGRSAGVLAAIAAATLMAGCGSGGGTPAATTSAPAAATPAPVVSGSGVGISAETGLSGGSAGNGAAAGSLSSAPTGTLSSGKSGNLISASAKATLSVAKTAVTHSSQSTVLMTPTQVKQAEQRSSSPTGGKPNDATAVTPPSSTATTPASATVNKPAGSSSSSATQQASSTPAQTHTKVLVIHRTKIVTLIRTRTITRTITKTVAPKVPAGAYLPSKKPELAQRVFTIAGGNLGCVLSGTGVRCGIEHRNWTGPAQPRSCQSSWGNTVALAAHGPARFACGGSAPVNRLAKVIPAGWDTTVGNYTCQIRSFGVNCFNAKSRSGFTLSRTGYSIY
jgi:hypothetical protein